MIEAFSEQLLTIDELRAKIPHLRARRANLRGQLDALDAQAADLTLAGDLEGFLAQLRGNAATARVEDRQRVLSTTFSTWAPATVKAFVQPRTCHRSPIAQ